VYADVPVDGVLEILLYFGDGALIQEYEVVNHLGGLGVEGVVEVDHLLGRGVVGRHSVVEVVAVGHFKEVQGGGQVAVLEDAVVDALAVAAVASLRELVRGGLKCS
jgi:hypothetical protein